jgi:UDP-N-acetylmuramoyl-tripeptide--D-alanyl-D-alanine ligase
MKEDLKITIDDLFELPNAAVYNSESFKPISTVTIDSRNVKKDALFIAIKGEKFDGHNFVCDAIDAGASAIIVEESQAGKFSNLKIPVVTVKDTTIALGDLAKVWRNKLKTKIIAITGSAGKTTTKEMLAAMLGEKFKVNKTTGNNNNHIGVPLTLFSTTNDYDILILEVGTNHFGEVAYSANIAQPDYAIITNIGNSHLEYLKNKKGVLTEKIALFESTAVRNGIIFINNDDILISKTMLDYPKRVTFGFESISDVKAVIDSFNEEGKPVIEITYKDLKIRQLFNLYGEQSAKNYLAAAAIAFKLGFNKKEIIAGISKFKSVDKRLNVRTFKKFVLIDDTYNANPESMRYAIELLPKIKSFKKKIAVLGDMLELGEESPKLHAEISRVIRRNKIDQVITIGELMKNLDSELKKIDVESIHFDDRKALTYYLKKFNFAGCVVLVKGSRGMQMEEFSKIIESKAHA